MNIVITGMSSISSKQTEDTMSRFYERIKQIRLVNDIEKLAIAAVGNVLNDAKIYFPVENANIGIYTGIDDAVEDIKNEYFNDILDYGLLGTSPLLFPYTAPNALAAQVSIAFDIRGENITMSIKNSCCDVIQYAGECIHDNYTKMAIAGGIFLKDKALSVENDRYSAEFFLLETESRAKERGAKIYRYIEDGINGDF